MSERQENLLAYSSGITFNSIMAEQNQIIIYQAEDGQTSIDVRMDGDTVWLSQKQMSELFDKDQSVIARHINNAFKEGEVEENSNMQILHNTLSKYKPTKVYSLDVVISVELPCYYTSSRRTTRSATATNESPPRFSFGSCRTTASSIAPTVQSASATVHLSQSP